MANQQMLLANLSLKEILLVSCDIINFRIMNYIH